MLPKISHDPYRVSEKQVLEGNRKLQVKGTTVTILVTLRLTFRILSGFRVSVSVVRLWSARSGVRFGRIVGLRTVHCLQCQFDLLNFFQIVSPINVSTPVPSPFGCSPYVMGLGRCHPSTTNGDPDFSVPHLSYDLGLHSSTHLSLPPNSPGHRKVSVCWLSLDHLFLRSLIYGVGVRGGWESIGRFTGGVVDPG